MPAHRNLPLLAAVHEIGTLKIAVNALTAAILQLAARCGVPQADTRVEALKVETLKAAPMDKLMDLEDVATLTGVTAQTISKQVRLGKLRAIRVGRVYRFRRSDVEEWFEVRSTTRPLPKRRQ